MNTSHTKISLRQYAYRVAGIHELGISFSLNFLIAVAVFRNAEDTYLAGEHSLLSMVGPMCFLLPSLTTFFGMLKAVRERAAGRVEPAWPGGQSWWTYATFLGIFRGIVGLSIAVGAMTLLDHAIGHRPLPKWPSLFGIGLLASLLGYWLHATAIVETGRRFPINPPETQP